MAEFSIVSFASALAPWAISKCRIGGMTLRRHLIGCIGARIGAGELCTSPLFSLCFYKQHYESTSLSHPLFLT